MRDETDVPPTDPEPAGEPTEIELFIAACAERIAQGELLDIEFELARIADPDRRAIAVRELGLLGIAREALGGRAPAPPRRLSDFELLEEIGRGAMGVVYRGRQVSLNRPVAVKVITGLATLDHRRVERFVREAHALARLRHPGIVPVIAAGQHDGAMYIAMELVDGVPLHTLTAGLQAVPPAQRTIEQANATVGRSVTGSDTSYVAWVVRVCAEAAEALQNAHEQGVLHRDVKPGNLMLGEQGEVRLIDFGLARILDADSSLTSVGVVGSPTYLPPEMFAEPVPNVTAQGDVYSLGVVLYELLAGAPPFVADSPTGLFAQITRSAPIPLRRRFPGLSRDLETICATAIEGSQTRRYASAGAFASDLRAFGALRPIAARPTPHSRRIWLWLRRNPAVALAGLAVLGITMTVAGVQLADRLHRSADIQATGMAFRRAIELEDVQSARSSIQRLTAIDDTHPDLAVWRASAAELQLTRTLSAARAELDGFREAHRQLSERTDERERLTAEMAVQHMPADRYLAALRLCQDCDRRDAERSALFLRAVQSLEDARAAAIAAGHPDHDEVRSLRAELLVLEWRWANRRGNTEWARLCEQQARELDIASRFTAEFDQPGSVSLAAPLGREVFLFRYRARHEFSVEDPSYRMVPVPFDLAARRDVVAGASDGRREVRPGDRCLVALASDEWRDSVGIEADDLIVALRGRSEVGGLWVKVVRAGSLAAEAGLRPYDRLVSADGAKIDCWADLRLAQVAAESVVFAFEGARDVRLSVSSDGTFATRSGIEVASLGELLASTPPPDDVALEVVRGDERLSIVMPAGRIPDLRVTSTAYPLWMTSRARLGRTPLSTLSLPPDEYMLAVRSPGRPPLRLPISIRAGSTHTLALHEPPSAPAGLDTVWIPADNLGAVTTHVAERLSAGFWIDRHEVTLGEWARFQNDPVVAAQIEREFATTGRRIFTLRDEVTLAPKTFRQDLRERFPVKSISHEDARGFVEWRNRMLAAAGSPWRASLPTRAEWRFAARGWTRRAYPWGNVFEPQLTEANLTTEPPVIQPVGSRLGDESPFGVRDLGGSAAEPTLDLYRNIPDVYVLMGGSNHFVDASNFTIASEDARPGSFVTSYLGLRLVYHLR